MHDLTPHAGRFQNIALVNARYLVLALASRLKSLACNTLNLVLAVLQHVVSALTLAAVCACALFVVEALTLAEVQATGKLANDHHVNAVDNLGLQCGGICQGVEDLNRTQVGVQAQSLADAQQALFRARSVRVGGVPLRATYRSKQNRIRCVGGIERCLRQRFARCIDGATADKGIFAREVDIVLLAYGIQHLYAFGHDFGADAVTGQRADLIRLGHSEILFQLKTVRKRYYRTKELPCRKTRQDRHARRLNRNVINLVHMPI